MTHDTIAEELRIPGVMGVQLVVNSFGTSIRRRGECFQLKLKEVKREIAASKVDSILVTTGAHFSTDAIELAIEHNVDVVLVDGIGRPFGRLWRTDFGSTAEIRRKQLAAADKAIGVNLSRELIHGKLQGRVEFIADLRRARPDHSDSIDRAITAMCVGIEAVQSVEGTSVADCRGRLMALEGAAGKAYFEVIGEALPEKYGFTSRSPRQHDDPVNAFLNYGYGVLYSRVECASILAGLDPHVGLLHTDRYNKPSMVCDLIEPFRVYVEKPIIYLFTRRRINDEHYQRGEEGLRLTEDGRKLLLSELNDHLEESVRYRSRNVKRIHVIQAEAHRIANLILQEVN